MHEPSSCNESAAAASYPEEAGQSGSAGAPVLAADGDAFDAELERRWTSVRTGLVDVLSALEERANKTEQQKMQQASTNSRPRKRPKKVDPSEWMRVYTDAAVLFSHNDPAKKRRMYGRVRDLLRGHVQEQLVALRKYVYGSGVSLLEQYTMRWDMSLQFVRYMKRVLHHLEHWVLLNSGSRSKMDPIRPLDRLLMFYWCEEVLSNLPELVNILLDMIDDDRKGKVVDHVPVRAVIDTLVMLGSADAPSPTVDALYGLTRRTSFHRNTAPLASGSLGGGSSNSAGRAESRLRTGRYGETGRPLGLNEDTPLSLHLYLQVFEDEFLRRTSAFYSAEAEKMMRGNCVSTFMQNVVSRLDEEIARGERLLHKDSVPRLRSTVEEKLVGAHMAYLQLEADTMIREGRESDLKMAFKLLERLDGGLAPIRDCLSRHIAGEGLEALDARADLLNSKEDVKKSTVIVDDLVTLHRSRSEMIHRCFGSAQIFVMALNDAFRSFANKPVGALSMPEILAYYIDNLMRDPRTALPSGCEVPGLRLPDSGRFTCSANAIGLSAMEQSPSSNLDPRLELMDSLIRLFMYIDDKDMFHETYRRLLAKRLLGKHDVEMEREFICKLKHQMGSLYTSKLSGMLKDVGVSNEARRKFLDYISALDSTPVVEGSKAPILPAHDINFTAHVLNGLYWPSFQTDRLRIPRALLQCQESFASFFRREQQLRKVTWIHSQSTNNVAAKFNGKDYTLVVSTFQACALLEFNNTTRLTLEELSSSLNVEPAAMARHMQPLVNSKKHKLFVCHGDLERVTAVELHATDSTSASDFQQPDEINPGPSEMRDERVALASGSEASVALPERQAAVRTHIRFARPRFHVTRPRFHVQRGGLAQVGNAVGNDAAVVGPRSELALGDEAGRFRGRLDIHSIAEGSNALFGSSNQLHNIGQAHGSAIAHQGMGDDNDDDDGYAIEDDDSPDIDAVVPPVGAPRDLASLALAAAAVLAESNVHETSNVVEENRLTLSDFPADPDLGTEKRLPNSLVPFLQMGCPDREGCSDSRLQDNDSESKIADRSLECMGRISNDQCEDGGAISYDGDEDDRSLKEVEATAPEQGDADDASGSDVRRCCHDTGSGDVLYELVESFSSKSIRVVYPATIARLTTREAATGRNAVVVDRGSLLDAALVRIMKQRKSLPLTQLTGEVMQQVSGTFRPDVRIIKERVEILIEREFIERSSDDPGMLLYCA